MAFVQSTVKKIADSVSGVQNFTATSNFTAGNDGFVTIQHFDAATSRVSAVTIGGTAGTKVIDKVSTDNANFSEIWRAANMAGGVNTFSVTLTANAGQFLVCGAIEWSGVTAGTTNTKTGSTGQTASAAPSATTAATVTTPVLLIGAFTDVVGTNWTSATPPASWTETYEEVDGTAHEAGSAAYFLDSSGTGAKTGTFATGASMTWVATIAAFELNAAAAAADTTTVMMLPMIPPMGARR